MYGQDDIAQHDARLHAQLRLFCHVMLGSADAADRMIQQIYRRALDHHDEQENWPSERVQLFRIAADLCGIRRQGRNRYGPGDDICDE
ncbi:hypothetical protein ACIHDR_48575 [Nocardia sp. NPDC052278]|uniref:hypothetical protein n=1 Tax=unclassified Nocardia TaxID=2637762 RepID=UPI00367815F5